MHHDIKQVMVQEEVASERQANHVRLATLGLFLLAYAFFYFKSEQHYTAGYVILANLLALLLYSLLLEWRLLRQAYHPALKYLSFAADLTGVSVLAVASLFLSQGPRLSAWMPVIGICFLFIALTALRFSPSLSAFMGVLAAAEFMAVNEISLVLGGEALPVPQRAMLALMMVATGIVLGVSVTRARALVVRIGQSERERALLRGVAEVSQHLAVSDELTGLANRRHFQEVAQRELMEAEQTGRKVAALIVDVDNFKEINDRHGHQVGDEVLRQIALLLTQQTRSSDIVARLGGDEFAILLSPMGPSPARQSAERLCEAVRLATFTSGAAAAIRVSVTIGFACFPDDARDFIGLVGAADKAMYVGKNSGKDRAEAAGEGNLQRT